VQDSKLKTEPVIIAFKKEQSHYPFFLEEKRSRLVDLVEAKNQLSNAYSFFTEILHWAEIAHTSLDTWKD
jgi:hypothetical protein